MAVENTFHLTKKIDLVAGASYDWRVLYQAQGWALDDQTFQLPVNGMISIRRTT